MSISSNNNFLYRRFAKDFKRKDKSFLKNLTYTQLEKEMKKELLKIDDLITLCRFYKVSADYFIGMTDQI